MNASREGAFRILPNGLPCHCAPTQLGWDGKRCSRAPLFAAPRLLLLRALRAHQCMDRSVGPAREASAEITDDPQMRLRWPSGLRACSVSWRAQALRTSPSLLQSLALAITRN